VGREEPGLQREVAAVHHGARGDGGLASAIGTLPGGPAALQRPPVAASARGTCEALRPSPPREILRARVIVREPGLEGLSRQGTAVFLPAGGHPIMEAQFSVAVKPRRLPYDV
jgi:hypothetical protein